MEREKKVASLVRQGYLRSECIKQALLKVPREEFIPLPYRDYAYREVPLPLPGRTSTISCPHSYPLFYESLALERGDRFLEIGLGSGYGTALAREIVGNQGLVVSIEIDPVTFAFAKGNLEAVGYEDIVLVQGDGGLGFAEQAPYNRICMTAACAQVPPPVLEQLQTGGRFIAPLIRGGVQDLVLLEKTSRGIQRTVVCEVLYVSLQGEYAPREF